MGQLAGPVPRHKRRVGRVGESDAWRMAGRGGYLAWQYCALIAPTFPFTDRQWNREIVRRDDVNGSSGPRMLQRSPCPKQLVDAGTTVVLHASTRVPLPPCAPVELPVPTSAASN